MIVVDSSYSPTPYKMLVESLERLGVNRTLPTELRREPVIDHVM